EQAGSAPPPAGVTPAGGGPLDWPNGVPTGRGGQKNSMVRGPPVLPQKRGGGVALRRPAMLLDLGISRHEPAVARHTQIATSGSLVLHRPRGTNQRLHALSCGLPAVTQPAQRYRAR